MNEPKKPRKKTTKAQPAEKKSSDPLVLATQLERFTISELADATGVPAREIRMALQPIIDDGRLERCAIDGKYGAWQWHKSK